LPESSAQIAATILSIGLPCREGGGPLDRVGIAVRRVIGMVICGALRTATVTVVPTGRRLPVVGVLPVPRRGLLAPIVAVLVPRVSLVGALTVRTVRILPVITALAAGRGD